MKKTLLSILLCVSIFSAHAQTVTVYGYNNDGSINLTPLFTTDKKVKVVFKGSSTEPQSGGKVEGTVVINDTTYTKAVGGTVADYVDLGMRDSNGKAILWATHNLGASKPEEYGAYIAWGDKGVAEEGYINGVKLKDGETYYFQKNASYNDHTAKQDYGYYKYTIEDNYIGSNWYKNSKFIGDNKTVLEPQDDAATVCWGEGWRMPTIEEWQTLINTDNYEWTMSPSNNGFTVTSKIAGYEGKSIFLPFCGYRSLCYFFEYGTNGYYSSCTLTSSTPFVAMCAITDGFREATDIGDGRYQGLSVRPVKILK